jgi:hypothetical protein
VSFAILSRDARKARFVRAGCPFPRLSSTWDGYEYSSRWRRDCYRLGAWPAAYGRLLCCCMRRKLPLIIAQSVFRPRLQRIVIFEADGVIEINPWVQRCNRAVRVLSCQFSDRRVSEIDELRTQPLSQGFRERVTLICEDMIDCPDCILRYRE